MRKIVSPLLENGRITEGRYGSNASFGLTGAFEVLGPSNRVLRILSSDGSDTSSEWSTTTKWEHVSVSLPNRTPNWAEMCFVKDLFWDDEEEVVQFHPKKSDYVNIHTHCLHLWKPVGVDILMPPKGMVG